MSTFIQAGGAAIVVVLAVAVASNSERRVAPPAPAFAVPAYARAINAQAETYAAAVGPQAPKAFTAVGGLRLRSVGFELPKDDGAFPPGPGADVIAGHCQTCHSPGMLLTQPPLTRAEWTGEVTKMRRVYKAPVSDDDAAVIVSYLAALQVAP